MIGAKAHGKMETGHVKRSADKVAVSVLYRFGAFVRRRARSSIRKKKRVSEPGQPPSGHLGLYRSSILFAVDPVLKYVVTGPIILNRGDGSAPRLLEHGGNAIRGRGKRRRSAYYRPRPVMGPAFEAELPKLAALWLKAKG